MKTGSQRLSSALARTILRSEGCAIALRRVATGIGTDAAGRANSVTHIAKAGGDPQTVEADCIISNAAPQIAAKLLPAAQGSKLTASYADRASSVSLFALTLGLSRKPDEIGLASYSTQLLPDWMTSLADYAKGTALFADEPARANAADVDRQLFGHRLRRADLALHRLGGRHRSPKQLERRRTRRLYRQARALAGGDRRRISIASIRA